jgi:hypothetical protein
MRLLSWGPWACCPRWEAPVSRQRHSAMRPGRTTAPNHAAPTPAGNALTSRGLQRPGRFPALPLARWRGDPSVLGPESLRGARAPGDGLRPPAPVGWDRGPGCTCASRAGHAGQTPHRGRAPVEDQGRGGRCRRHGLAPPGERRCMLDGFWQRSVPTAARLWNPPASIVSIRYTTVGTAGTSGISLPHYPTVQSRWNTTSAYDHSPTCPQAGYLLSSGRSMPLDSAPYPRSTRLQTCVSPGDDPVGSGGTVLAPSCDVSVNRRRVRGMSTTHTHIKHHGNIAALHTRTEGVNHNRGQGV